MKRFLILMLILALGMNLCACNRRGGQQQGEVYDAYGEYEDYNELCQAIYDDNLGQFYQAYEQAKAAENVSMRHALMAVAEAKLLAAAVMLPLNASGGNYGISRLAPYTVPSVLWGNDNQRFHRALVTTAPITAAHRQQMKEKWYELKGTGEYLDWAEDFLEGNGYTLKNSYTKHSKISE